MRAFGQRCRCNLLPPLQLVHWQHVLATDRHKICLTPLLEFDIQKYVQGDLRTLRTYPVYGIRDDDPVICVSKNETLN